ncbi:PAS domain S-box-containing protein/diguanylate cyclase (GGDEF)-like protein [Tahibacter aquaticus]|uniref:cyclic-guanylate-specific phosphodiesterase n=1 Tax=Tahibacter aquaticus TaxID=520092 RepID=A0A4V3DLF7_9GAMM|nr:EAL domain-containing protein [Tahibacter aquaticus]TDR39201.1 PAS domain S-box-containing protein/diguanylate cyclase (GGDEF)-like protein [Tahibacter aquaticus]
MSDSRRLHHGAQWLRRQNEILRLLALGAPRERVLEKLAELLRLEFPTAAIGVVVREDGRTCCWSGSSDVVTAALFAALAESSELARAEGWFDLRSATTSLVRWSELAIADGYSSLWVEPLHEVDGLRMGQLLIALNDRREADSSAQTMARVAATIAELVFQRDAAVALLQQGRELYRSLLDNHPDAVLYLDAESRIRGANEAARLVFGRSKGELDDVPLQQLFDDSTYAALQVRLPSVLRGTAQSMEATVPRPGARARELELILVPLRDRARTSGLFLIARDVTRFRASEQALRRTYEQSLLRRDQLLDLNQVALAAAALNDVHALLLQLARSMAQIDGVDFVRVGLEPAAVQQRGREVICVVTRPARFCQADRLPSALRSQAMGLAEPQRQSWQTVPDDGQAATENGHWLGMGLRSDRGIVIGTLEWFGLRDGVFDDDDEVLLQQFARLTVSNVQRCWMHLHLGEAQRGVAQQLAFVRAMAASIGEGLYAIDRSGRLTFVNQAAREMLGWDGSELPQAGEALQLSAASALGGPAMRAMQQDARIAEHAQFAGRDGRPMPVDLIASPLNFDGEVAGAVVVFRDISERLQAEEARLERDRFFSLSPELFVIVDAQGRLSQFNPATHLLLKRSPAQVLHSDWRAYVHADDVAATATFTAQVLAQGRVDAFVNRWVDAEGEVHWLEWAAALSPDQRIFAVARNITVRRRYEKELAHYASHDATTGLPRTEQIEAFLNAALAAAALREGRVSVFYLDLDRFHLINDSRGHVVGDQVLHAVAQRLLQSLGEQGRVARIAGDEFLLVRVDSLDGPDQQELGEALRQLIEQPITLGTQQIYLTCSVGVSCFPENGAQARELMHQAEAAMIQAKDDGRNAVASFSNDYSQTLKDKRELGLGLREAILNDQLVLHFQPQIGAHDWQVRGVEALVRWNHPQHGLLAPGRFIPVAEELGIIVELGQWVLESACRRARGWLDSGLAEFTVAVNVSAVQLQRPDFLERVQRALEVSRLPPRYLELELTESMVMAQVERVIVAMRSLKALGVSLSLDDFGSGYSSLSYLRRFPIDKLKIDQSFVRDIITDPGSAGICRAVISLGHQLGMTVSAEGVETLGQAAFLRRNECDQFQGNYFCVPMPEAQTFDVLRRRYLRQDAMNGVLEERGGGGTLLLLDDEENVLRALVRLLRRDGYRIETATSARQAFEILAAQPVQVIISDQRMPDISGTEFLSRVKDMYPATVRLILSGYSDFASLTEAVNRGAVYRFVAKPWDDEELRRMVREAFRMAATG